MNTADIKPRIDDLMAEVTKRYDLTFIDIGVKKGAKFYIFGGALRDMLLGNKWKEIDVRVFIDQPHPKRDEVMEEILSEAGIKISSKIPFGEAFTVYRFVPPNSASKTDIDLSVESKHMSVGPDFTINGLYLDISTRELIDPYKAIEAITKKEIRTVLDPQKQFKDEPWMIFRAVKASCQFGFDIEPDTLEGMRINSPLTKPLMQSIVDKSMGGLTEWLLGNMLRGLKYDPHRFVQIWNTTDVSRNFIEFVSEKSTIETSATRIENPFKSGAKPSFEEGLNVFFSQIARAVDPSASEKVFVKIIEIFEITQPKQFEDFVIDAKKIQYVA